MKEDKFLICYWVFFQNDENYANVKKSFLFYMKILKEKKGEMKRNRGEKERDGVKGRDLLIPPNKH